MKDYQPIDNSSLRELGSILLDVFLIKYRVKTFTRVLQKILQLEVATIEQPKIICRTL